MPDFPNDKAVEPQESAGSEEGPAELGQQDNKVDHRVRERRSEPDRAELREAVFGGGETPPPPREEAGSIPTPGKPEELEEEEPQGFWARLRASATRSSQGKTAPKAAPNREALRQNKTPLLLGGLGLIAAMAVWFLYVVSAPMRQGPSARTPSVGTAPAQTPASTRSLVPGTDAQPQQTPTGPDKGVTAADIRATGQDHPARSNSPAPPSPQTDPYALNRIPPPPATAPASPPAPAASPKNPLDQSSLVFVRNEAKGASETSNSSGLQPVSWTPALLERSEAFTDIPTGTRLVARLETPASSAVRLPVVAAIEYNYEDANHELVIPAGSRAYGTLEQADSQGFVGMHFTQLQFPDRTNPVPFEARAIGLNFQPLKGTVTGRNTGRRFLVRAFSGIGSITAATVGVQNGTGVTDSFSNNALLREQLMTNIGSAGDQELQQLAYQQHIVVTVPGNTRFYLVMDHTKAPAAKEPHPHSPSPSGVNVAGEAAASSGMSVEELRELIQLRRELNQINQQSQASQPSGAGPANETAGTPAGAAANPAQPPEIYKSTIPTNPSAESQPPQ